MIKQLSTPVCCLLRVYSWMECGHTDPGVECYWCSVLFSSQQFSALTEVLFHFLTEPKEVTYLVTRRVLTVGLQPWDAKQWRPGFFPFCRWKGFWLSSLSLPPPIRSVLALSEASWKASFWFQMVSSLSQQLRPEMLLEFFQSRESGSCSGHWASAFSREPDMGGTRSSRDGSQVHRQLQ